MIKENEHAKESHASAVLAVEDMDPVRVGERLQQTKRSALVTQIKEDNIDSRGLSHFNGADHMSVNFTTLQETRAFFLACEALHEHHSHAAEGARSALTVDDAESTRAASGSRASLAQLPCASMREGEGSPCTPLAVTRQHKDDAGSPWKRDICGMQRAGFCRKAVEGL